MRIFEVGSGRDTGRRGNGAEHCHCDSETQRKRSSVQRAACVSGVARPSDIIASSGGSVLVLVLLHQFAHQSLQRLWHVSVSAGQKVASAFAQEQQHARHGSGAQQGDFVFAQLGKVQFVWRTLGPADRTQ